MKILDILDTLGVFWAIVGILGILGNSGQVWVILGILGTFGHFGQLWAFWPRISGYFWAIEGILDIDKSCICLLSCVDDGFEIWTEVVLDESQAPNQTLQEWQNCPS